MLKTNIFIAKNPLVVVLCIYLLILLYNWGQFNFDVILCMDGEWIDASANTAPSQVYLDLQQWARRHVFDETNPTGLQTLEAIRAFIECKTSHTPGHSLPSGSRSEIMESLVKLDKYAEWSNTQTTTPPGNFNSYQWVMQNCRGTGVNRGVLPGAPFN